jgi:hypothetical protein
MSQPLRLVPQFAQPIEFACPICAGVHAAYIFSARHFRIYRCGGCALTFSTTRFRGVVPLPPTNLQAARPARSEKDYSALLSEIEFADIKGPVLVVADEDDEVVTLLRRRAVEIGRIVGPDAFNGQSLGEGFKAAIVSDALMRVEDLRGALTTLRQRLPLGAPVVMSLPLLDGKQAELMGRNWHEWQPSNRWYFTRETISLLLLSAGFEQIWLRPEPRRYSLNDLSNRMGRSLDGRGWLRSLETIRRLAPKMLRDVQFRLPSGTAVISARAAAERTERVVSIVVPLFNEARTFQAMMDGLLAKELPGMRKEIIVVESNSTDGSRDLARAYESHPDVRVLLQPAPRGKGNAVREGFDAATGEILMIQDADLEYDLEDYDGLLAPLVAWQSMFVLGSRHQGTWKMREFTDAPLLAAFFNLGHAFFRSLINIALNRDMADPFTMYKVFRKDALHGLSFVCHRFDFDIELVIKLNRKGYVPLEIPVNYVSRSFAEGKKVSVTRDGMTWVKTILKARFSPLDRK